jgi:protein tyrosine phosphatase (PTP) superfamily phosphohydrolase (DUF442 family)
MPTWVIQNDLARGRRPGYSGERGRSVPAAEVRAWIEEVRASDIKSIICLLSDDQLPLYDQLPSGLIAFYRAEGFAVEHIPAQDHQHPPLTPSHLQKVWAAYKALPKPVLVHCSAGVDRTRQAVAHIQSKLRALQFSHHDHVFEIDEEWWRAAGMPGFVPGSQSYKAGSPVFRNLPVVEVRIDDIEPLRRELSHGVFNNDADTGLSAEERVLKILDGFRSNAALPPVEIQELPTGEFKYRLHHGAHRLYLSVAVGFTHIPAIDVTDR